MAAQDYKELGSTVLRGYGKFLKEQNNSHLKLLEKVNKKSPNLLKIFYPINITLEPYEDIHLLNIIESDNRVLRKVIATFSSLCGEIQKLQEEANNRFYYFIALYGINYEECNVPCEEFVSRYIKHFHHLNSFVKRCYDVVINLTKQIYALIPTNLINTKILRLEYVISKIGDILLVLVTLDHLMNASPINTHWLAYKRLIKSLHGDVSKVNMSAETLKSLEGILNEMEERLFCDKIFEQCINYLVILNNAYIQSSKTFISEEIVAYLKKCVSDLEKSSVEYYESMSSIQWAKVNALYVFYALVFGNADKKILKSLIEVNVKAHSVPLFGMIIWYPEQFLTRYIPFLLSNNNKLSYSIGKARQMYMNNKKQSLLKDVYNAQIQIAKWSINMHQTFSIHEAELNSIQMNHRMELLNQGLKFASQINFLVITFMSLHISQGMLTKNSLSCICKFVEILKSIEQIFLNNHHSIFTSGNLIVQHVSYQLTSKLHHARKAMVIDKNYSKQKLDELTAFIVVERALRGPLTTQRRIVINVALTLIPSTIFNTSLHASLIENIESAINVQKRVKEFCNCMFLYWNRFMISHFMRQMIHTKKDLLKITLLAKAISDSFSITKINEKTYGDYTNKLFDQIIGFINDIVIKQLGQEIETNLRLHTHTHLKLDVENPFNTTLEDVNPLLVLPPIKLNNHFVSVIHGIEYYLSYMFYNLTTVVLHDWRTYGEMRQLANMKFEIKAIEDNLPTQTLEQGLDILDLMRNIHIFVSKYLYNLNNQIFIEYPSNSKTLNTINIIHIANSIRTHGTGIINTTVNFTYQFLRKKFHTFSQFMYDEQIKSRLIKDVRYFRESSNDSEQMYTYKRADKFNKNIKNLGLNEEGKSYLDLFRILVSEIGNAMGYVRMVRSGGLHCCGNASAYLPSLEHVWSFDQLLQDSTLSEHTTQSIKNLENTINNLISNFFNGTEYFKLFVDVFSPVFRNPENAHLKPFYIIVPPLTLNFVENILLCKDKLNKRNLSGAAFTDDGFAMGLAYILKLLDQEQEMDSLHWFESVNSYIAKERKTVEEQLSKGSSSVHQALALTQKKLNVLEQEFQLLYFSFSSARIFFQV